MTSGVVYVVDDDRAIRDSLSLLLDLRGLAVHAFASAEAFLATVGGAEPAGCVMIDLRMDGTSGLELHKVMKERGWRIPCIVMSAYGDVATTRAALKSGAIDFLEKPLNDPDYLLEVVHHALAVDQAQRQAKARVDSLRERYARLTPRERDVMRRLSEGMSNREIAADLSISHRTIEIYKAGVFEKMGIRTTAELVRLEIELNDGIEPRRAHRA